MANLNFDASTVESTNDFDVLPAGWYNATIMESEQVIAKSGNGEYLKLTFSVSDGAHANRRLFAILNLWNSNETACDIAKRDLGSICDALGLSGVGDSSELHGKPLQVKVKIRTSEEYGDQNDIGGYKAVSGNVMPTAGVALAAAAPAAAAAPWSA